MFWNRKNKSCKYFRGWKGTDYQDKKKYINKILDIEDLKSYGR